MSSETKTILGIVISILVVFAIIIYAWNRQDVKLADPEKLNGTDSYSLGPVDAKVTIVEFADFQCPACAAAEPIMMQFMDEYKDKSVRYIYRHFPIHNHSLESMNAGEYAGEEGKFFEYSQMLFANQSEWGDMPGDPTQYFVKYGKELGLDTVKLAEAVASKKYESKVNKDFSDAGDLGVNSTPTFFINGKKYVGVQPLSTLKTIVDGLLAE